MPVNYTASTDQWVARPLAFLLALLVIFGIPFVCLYVYYAAKNFVHGRQDKRAGVVAQYCGLRITTTELIEGYAKNANRHSLAALTATVRTICVPGSRKTQWKAQWKAQITVHGPHTSITRTGDGYDDRTQPDREARQEAQQFADTLNQASRAA